jgi:hemoglobin-like flavoprotein
MPNTELMEARLRFLEIDDATIGNLQDAFEIIEPEMDRITEAFYQHLLKEPELKQMLNESGVIERAKLAQEKHWIEAMLRGQYDNAYFLKAERIGRTHARLGLTPNWYIGAYNYILNQFSDVICDHCLDDSKRALALIQSVTKIVFLDIDLVIQTYLQANGDHLG